MVTAARMANRTTRTSGLLDTRGRVAEVAIPGRICLLEGREPEISEMQQA
jgi:hypothetical protein